MIFAKDLDRMSEFYRRSLDLEDEHGESSDGFIVLARPGARVALHALPDHVAPLIEIDDPPRARSDVALKLLFRVDDVPACLARIEQFGGQAFETEGDDAYDALDPEGNVIRIYRVVDPG